MNHHLDDLKSLLSYIVEAHDTLQDLIPEGTEDHNLAGTPEGAAFSSVSIAMGVLEQIIDEMEAE